MAEIIGFQSAAERELREMVQQLIAELGVEAERLVLHLAGMPSLEPGARDRLLAVAERIAEAQGFAWYAGSASG